MVKKLVKREIAVILDSDEKSGALQKSADGSTFTVQFEQPLFIPRNAINPTLDVEESAVWFSTPNIFDGSTGETPNNTFRVNDIANTYDLTIPQGVYDIPAIKTAINDAYTDVSGITSEFLQILRLNEATGKTELAVGVGAGYIEFVSPNSIANLLGFLEDTQYTQGGGPTSILYVSPNIPQVNNVNFYLIQCDLVDRGIRFNNNYNQIIETILIDVAPGEQILTRPYHPPTCMIDHIAGNPVSNVRVALLTDSLIPANTGGENYYVRISLKWYEQIDIHI
jgi:hypothetical protein